MNGFHLVNEPAVYLVGRQQTSADVDRFLADHGVSWATDSEVGGEALCEIGGRLCYMSFARPRPGGNRAYLEHILEVGHGSVLEHAVWNLVFTGVSRSLTHELVRHRAGMGYSQLSQRYVDESVAEYVVPPDLQLEVECFRYDSARPDQGDEEAARLFPRAHELYQRDRDLFRQACEAGQVWQQTVRQAHDGYVYLSTYLSSKARREHPGLATTEARKYARQAARSVLPNATETKIFVTANARALRHFIEMRCSRFADPEIRRLAYQVWLVLRQEAPNLFSDYQETVLADGTREVSTAHRKV